jgi:hypothetical protein
MSALLLPPAKAPTLYELEDSLAALIDTGEGGIPDELRAEYEAELYQTLTATKAKRDRCGEFIRHLDAQAELAKAESKRLAARAADFQIMRERLCAYIRRTMELTGQRKLEGDYTTFALRQNPPYVQIDNEAQIPREYFRHIPESWTPDKTAIAKAIKAGAEVHGADLMPGAFRLEVK